MIPQTRKATTISIPAPTMGWNTRDPITSMPPEFGSIMDDVFCMPNSVMVRRGYEQWATGFTGIAETVFDYEGFAGEELFAAVDNSGTCAIYDVTSSGAVGAAVVSGLTSARFKHSHFSTSGGLFTYAVNGADSALLYDGTTWHSVTGVSSPYAITGVTTSLLKDVVAFKRRLWFVETGSMSCWYLAIDSVSGAATEYDFGPIFKRGGTIIKIDTWSLDAGEGLDDHFAIFTSAGEVAIYKGTDPASASTWQLVGVFYIGAPVGTGHTAKYGGDLLIANKDGIAPMSKALMSSRVNSQSMITDAIRPTVSSDAMLYGSNYGWDLTLYPDVNMLLMNIPISTTESYQYVMNTITGAWSRWTGIPAKSWYYANDTLWFGADGYVGRMWQANSDNGAAVSADILPSYQNYGSASALKRWNLARVSLATDGSLSYGIRMEVDFNLAPTAISLGSSGTAAGVYGTAIYGTSIYGGALSVLNVWKNVSGIGYYGSLRVRVDTQHSDVFIYGLEVNLEGGATI